MNGEDPPNYYSLRVSSNNIEESKNDKTFAFYFLKLICPSIWYFKMFSWDNLILSSLGSISIFFLPPPSKELCWLICDLQNQFNFSFLLLLQTLLFMWNSFIFGFKWRWRKVNFFFFLFNQDCKDLPLQNQFIQKVKM